jgi:hypothetical protein
MTQAIETKFNFKARKVTDTEGKEVGKTKKQPSLIVGLPQPTADEVIEYLVLPDTTDEKGVITVDKVKALVLEAIQEIVRTQAKNQLDELIDSFGADDTQTVSAENIDYDKLSLEYIANLPPAQRGARAIPDEDWESFFADYLQVMVAATGKPETKIKNHLDLFKKPTRVKNNKDALNVLVEQIDVYLTASQAVEDTGECASRLRGKFVKWVEEDAKLDLSAL